MIEHAVFGINNASTMHYQLPNRTQNPFCQCLHPLFLYKIITVYFLLSMATSIDGLIRIHEYMSAAKLLLSIAKGVAAIF